MGHDRLPKLAFEWEFEDRRRRGKPRKIWMSGVKAAILNRDLAIIDSLKRVLSRRRVFS